MSTAARKSGCEGSGSEETRDGGKIVERAGAGIGAQRGAPGVRRQRHAGDRQGGGAARHGPGDRGQQQRLHRDLSGYERLLQYKVENGVGTSIVEPSLAKSWTSDAAGLVWTFKLAPGHKFEDGSPVDAEAVKFSFERLLKIKGGPADTFGEISEIEALDPLTVRFTLADTFAPFLSTFTLNGASIVSPKVMEHEEDGDLGQAYLADHTHGQRALQVASWEKGQQIVRWSPIRIWTGPSPPSSKIVIRIIKEASARRLQLEKGDST